MSIPQLVTKELFEKALRKFYDHQEICILEHQSEWAVPVGDNFASDLLRCRVTYSLGKKVEVNTMSVVIKISPESRDAVVLNTLKDFQLFRKEIEMYTETLPKIHTILGDLGTLSPRCLYAEKQPVQLLFIEDLLPLKYKMKDRREGLDLEHCLLVMKKLAYMHAASMVLYRKNPKVFLNYDSYIFSGHPFMVNWVNVAIDCIISSCRLRADLKKYIPKLEEFKNNLLHKCAEATRARADGLNVLNHADGWINNFLFLYDAYENLTDLKLIDYQFVVYAGPGVDLQYFWSTSPSMSVRLEHFDTILNYYTKELTKTLIKLDYPKDKLPTIEDIYKDFASKAVNGLAAGLITLCLIKSDKRKDACLENLLGSLDKYEGSFREHVYTNDCYWKHFGHLLQFLDKLGLFD